MSKLSILTGKIKTGKTTRLMHWAAAQKNIDGIFQPVIDDKRFIYHIGLRTLKPLETTGINNIISIGKYNFSNATFAWAQIILNDCLEKKLNWIVVDEIGPLELESKGLEPAITNLISHRNEIDAKVLCVVRDSILEKFLEHYCLQNDYQIFELPE
ncbi:MAG: nucleoside-triphosphatase [Bacteroidota bacterium]